MKKINSTIFAWLCIFVLCLVSCSSAPDPIEDETGKIIGQEIIPDHIEPQMENEQGDDNPVDTENEVAKGSPVDTVCPEHPDWFHSLSAELADYAESLRPEEDKLQDPDAYLKINDQYFNIFVRTEDINPISFCRYYGISKEEYVQLYERMNHLESFINDYREGRYESFAIYYQIDALFSDGEEFNEYFMKDSFKDRAIKSERIMPKEECNHTYTYHTIHYTLIEFVGEEKYNEFKEEFAGTEDFNIINFLNYFQIDKELYLKMMEEAGHTGVLRGKDSKYLHFYHPQYLFGSEEEQELYFVCHPLRGE